MYGCKKPEKDSSDTKRYSQAIKAARIPPGPSASREENARRQSQKCKEICRSIDTKPAASAAEICDLSMLKGV